MQIPPPILPLEIWNSILLKLEPAALSQATRFCHKWNNIIIDAVFLKNYTRNLPLEAIASRSIPLPPRLLLHFSHVQMQCISRPCLNKISENELNKRCLRVAKLISSLSWYRELVQSHFMQLTDPQQYRYCKPYFHLFKFGHAKVCDFEEDFLGHKLMTRKEVLEEPWPDGLLCVERLLKADYDALKQEALDQVVEVFKREFSKHRDINVKNAVEPSGVVRLPIEMFRGLFSRDPYQSLPCEWLLLHISLRETLYLTCLEEWLNNNEAIKIDCLFLDWREELRNINLSALTSFINALDSNKVKNISLEFIINMGSEKHKFLVKELQSKLQTKKIEDLLVW